MAATEGRFAMPERQWDCRRGTSSEPEYFSYSNRFEMVSFQYCRPTTRNMRRPTDGFSP